MTATKLGVVFTADRLPEELPAFASAAEGAGLDELWVWEDCFLAGGIAASATALAVTNRITVGLGVMPVVFRNPVAAAMEIATLARLYPGRFVAGLGHGVPGWMEQIGALPAKPMRALEETVSSIRRLLAGERFSLDGEHVDLHDVRLEQQRVGVPRRRVARHADVLCDELTVEVLAVGACDRALDRDADHRERRRPRAELVDLPRDGDQEDAVPQQGDRHPHPQ